MRLADIKVWHVLVVLVIAGVITYFVLLAIHDQQQQAQAAHQLKCALQDCR